MPDKLERLGQTIDYQLNRGLFGWYYIRNNVGKTLGYGSLGKLKLGKHRLTE